MKSELTHEQLTKTVSYDQETGLFAWSAIKRQGVTPGRLAGCVKHRGYVHINILGSNYYAHRLAWFYINKSWPVNNIDHIDGNTSNNRILNLRDITQAENTQNRRCASKNNKTGLLGASLHSGSSKYMSKISRNGKQKNLGYFDTPEEAHQAYLTAKRELHATCTI